MLKVPPKHIPSPVQARQEVFLWGPVQEYLECETLYVTLFRKAIDQKLGIRKKIVKIKLKKSEYNRFRVFKQKSIIRDIEKFKEILYVKF